LEEKRAHRTHIYRQEKSLQDNLTRWAVGFHLVSHERAGAS
jgi:hypothetical protein